MFAIKVARRIGDEGLVVAIELDSVHVKYLEKNVKLNGLENVVIVKKLPGAQNVIRFKRFT